MAHTQNLLCRTCQNADVIKAAQQLQSASVVQLLHPREIHSQIFTAGIQCTWVQGPSNIHPHHASLICLGTFSSLLSQHSHFRRSHSTALVFNSVRPLIADFLNQRFPRDSIIPVCTTAADLSTQACACHEFARLQASCQQARQCGTIHPAPPMWERWHESL